MAGMGTASGVAMGESMSVSAGVTASAGLPPAVGAAVKKAGVAGVASASLLGGKMGKALVTAMKSAMSMVGIMAPAAIAFIAGKEAVSFEKTMIGVRANARLLGEEGEASFRKLNSIARELGATTQFTAVQSAEALNKLVLGGLNAQEAMGAIPSVLHLAASANLELAESAKIVVDNMRKYGMEARDTGKIADFLSSAQSRAQITARDLAQGLLSLGSISAAMNVTFQDTVAVLTGMGRAGTEMSRAGTAFAMALARLSRQPPEVKRALEDLNVDVKNFVNESGGFEIVELFGAISRSLPTDPIERGAKAMELFGARGREILGVLNLMREGRFVEETQVGLMEDLGRAARVAEAKLDTFWGVLKKLRSGLGELFISGFTPILKAFEPLIDLTRIVIVAFSKIVAFLSPLKRLLQVIVMTTAFIWAIKAAIWAWGLASKATAASMIFLQSVSSPVGMAKVAAGVIAATAAIILMETALAGVGEEVKAASEQMGQLADTSAIDRTVNALGEVEAKLRAISFWRYEGLEPGGEIEGFGAEVVSKMEREIERLKEKVQGIVRPGLVGAPSPTEEQLGTIAQMEAMEDRMSSLRIALRSFGTGEMAAEAIDTFHEALGSLNESGRMQKTIDQLHALVDAEKMSWEEAKAAYTVIWEESSFGKIAKQIEGAEFKLKGLTEGWDKVTIAVEKFALQDWVRDDQVEKMRMILREIEEKEERIREGREREKEVKGITEGLMTPVEKMREEFEKLVGLRASLGEDVFARGMEGLKEKLEEKPKELMAPGRMGFAQFGKTLQDALLQRDDPGKETARNTAEGNKLLAEIRDIQKRPPHPFTGVFTT